MKYYHCTQEPLKIYGLAHKGDGGRFWKLHESVVDRVNDGVKSLGRRNTGGRVRFSTDSAHVSVRVILKTLGIDINFSSGGSGGVDIYAGKGAKSHYIGRVIPHNYSPESMDNTEVIYREPVWETLTLNMPRNEIIGDIIIGIDDEAGIAAPEEYEYPTPIAFYGSSITEGCSAERPGCAYTSMVSRWLDADYYNFGFSGAARGEPVMAEYIAGLDISVLVYDYDHNAPSAEFLTTTHERFFRRFRELRPDTPVIILSRPDFYPHTKESKERREVIERTYKNAVSDGDKAVWYIDGEALYGGFHPEDCTIDNCHPNGAGFMRMAERIYPVLREALER